MGKREAVRAVHEGRKPEYVPWSFSFTHEAAQKLIGEFGDDLPGYLDNHFSTSGNHSLKPEKLPNDRIKDEWGVVWDRSKDEDIGIVEGQVLPQPSLKGFEAPQQNTAALLDTLERSIANAGDTWRVFGIGFSLYERAWTLRGMTDLMMDFYDHPQFVHDLLTLIADYNIAIVKEAVKFDIDAIYFGDDWGQQKGLQMGRGMWMEFIYPQLKRMYAAATDAGKFVYIHSCGDVDELFDDLIDIGLACFNPFQPEVMDVDALIPKYRGRLAFHGGLSTQQTLPFGSTNDVIRESQHLLQLGSEGGYVFAPAHAVEGDVPLANMIAFIDQAKQQITSPVV